MKRILVPTDFSKISLNAINYASQLCKKSSAEMVLVHACDKIENNFKAQQVLIGEYNKSYGEEVLRKLEIIKEAILAHTSITITLKVYDGEVTNSILQAIKDYHADLIVMGTLGKTGLKGKIFGSKTIAIFRRSPIPLLTIPPDKTWKEPSNIVVAVHEEHESMVSLFPVINLANLYKAKLSIVVFSEENDEAYEVLTHSMTLQSIYEKVKKNFPSIETNMVHLSGTDFNATIHEYLKDNEVDIAALIAHHKSWLQYLMGKSMTQKLAMHSSVPLLLSN